MNRIREELVTLKPVLPSLTYVRRQPDCLPHVEEQFETDVVTDIVVVSLGEHALIEAAAAHGVVEVIAVVVAPSEMERKGDDTVGFDD